MHGVNFGQVALEGAPDAHIDLARLGEISGSVRQLRILDFGAAILNSRTKHITKEIRNSCKKMLSKNILRNLMGEQEDGSSVSQRNHFSMDFDEI